MKSLESSSESLAVAPPTYRGNRGKGEGYSQMWLTHVEYKEDNRIRRRRRRDIQKSNFLSQNIPNPFVHILTMYLQEYDLSKGMVNEREQAGEEEEEEWHSFHIALPIK